MTVTGDGTVISDKPVGALMNCTAANTGEPACSKTYILNEVVKLTAQWGSNTDSVTWDEYCAGNIGNTIDITMDSDKNCTVRFNPKVDGCFADSSINKNLDITTSARYYKGDMPPIITGKSYGLLARVAEPKLGA